jgi:hypothetical protein
LTAVVGKLSAEVRYLSSNNRISCRASVGHQLSGIFSLLKRCFAIIFKRQKVNQCWVQKFVEKLLKMSVCTESTDGEAAVSCCAHWTAVEWPAFDRSFKTLKNVSLKTEPIETVAFSFGITENTVFSNAIDSVSFGRHWKYYLFFDIISYHIICQKNDIISFISYR